MSSFWDKVAGIYDLSETINYSVNEQLAAAAGNEIEVGDLVLDCACGTGLLAVAESKKAAHVTATDLSKKMLIRLMIKARKKHITNISFAKSDICSLKAPDNYYNAVSAGNVFHLLDDPDKAFAELYRVTKKGGKIILPTYLTSQTLISRIIVGIYSVVGYCGKKYTADEYMQLISRLAQSHGCAEYSTRMIYGFIPAAFAVITK